MANYGNSDSTLNEARIAVERQREQKLKLENARAIGALVDRDKAEMLVFSYARSLRDGLLSWVTRSAPIIAAELDVSEADAFAITDRLMREYLIESADEFKLSPSDNGSNTPCDSVGVETRVVARSGDEGIGVGGSIPSAGVKRQRRTRKVAD